MPPSHVMLLMVTSVNLVVMEVAGDMATDVEDLATKIALKRAKRWENASRSR